MNKVLLIALVAGLTISANAASKVAALENPAGSTTAISTETATMENVVPDVPAKKWSASLESENYKGLTNKNPGVGSDVQAWEKAEVKYKITDRDSVSIAQEWLRNYGRGDNEANEDLQDTSVRYTRSGYKLPSDVAYAVQGRVYVPTSEGSQDAGQITQLRMYNMFSKEVAKNLEAAVLINPRLFIQDSANVNNEGSKRFRLLNSVGLKYSITEKVAIEQTVGLYMKWKNATDRADFLDASTSVYISAASWLDLNIGIRQTDEASDSRSSGAKLYAGDQSEYYAIATFSM